MVSTLPWDTRRQGRMLVTTRWLLMISTGAASVEWAEEGQVSRQSQGSGSVKGRLDEHLDPAISALGVYPISVVHRGTYSDVYF